MTVPPLLFAAVDLWLTGLAHEGRHLPLAGGHGEQPAALMDAFRLLDMIRAERGKSG